MQVTNKYYYFGRNDATERVDGWEEGWDCRFIIDAANEEIIIEEIATGSTHIPFHYMWQFGQVFGKVQNEVITSLIGAPNNG
jgi:hypothetical protein